ncbi:MFS transporter [Chloroflexota bacterium]
MDSSQKFPKVFYGWYIVGACSLIALYVAGVVYFGFTAVVEPIAEEFGWSYAQISMAASLRGLEIGLLAPVMGLLVDRFGPRRIVIGGSIILCTGFLVLSRVSSLPMFYGAFALIAIGASTCTQTVLITAVANWFHRKAGMAIGIAASGFGLGGLLVPLVTKLIDSMQWRTAMSMLGLGMISIVLPLSLLIRHKPENYGYQPDRETLTAPEINKSRVLVANAEVNIPPMKVLRHGVFWNVATGSVISMLAIGAMITHVMPALSSLGIARTLSSLAALILPVASIGGRLGGGWLSDRFGNKQVFIASFVLLGIGLILFAFLTIEMFWLIVPFIIAFCLGWGFSITSRISLLRDHFGRSRFGTILGFVSGIMMFGMITGAPLAGWVFDTWGSYVGAWLSFGALAIAGAVLAIMIPSSRSTAQRKDHALL